MTKRRTAGKKKAKGLPGKYDIPGAEKAIRAFLQAAGFDPKDPKLAETPELVAKAWGQDLLAGYREDPQKILKDPITTQSKGLVMVRDIRFHSMCPHHLLPYHGRVHLGYYPNQKLAGFSRLVKLVDALSKRLTLQEELGEDIAEAVLKHLGAKGVGVMISANHSCVSARGVGKDAQSITHSWKGLLDENDDLREEFFHATQLKG